MDKILIVEDDTDIAELIRDYFEMNGFVPTICKDGKDGLALGLSGNFDIILLDIMLPSMDGFEILKNLRKVTNIPILFASAKDSDIDVVRGFGIGADDYIKKPFIPSELVARAKANLVRYRELVAHKEIKSVETFGDFTVDFDARRVMRNDNEITLTNKEFELLEFFLKNPDKVYSREVLFTKVWNIGAYGDITTVTVHIKRLREKIEPDCNNPSYIETVWGVGYRFNANLRPK